MELGDGGNFTLLHGVLQRCLNLKYPHISYTLILLSFDMSQVDWHVDCRHSFVMSQCMTTGHYDLLVLPGCLWANRLSRPGTCHLFLRRRLFCHLIFQEMFPLNLIKSIDLMQPSATHLWQPCTACFYYKYSLFFSHPYSLELITRKNPVIKHPKDTWTHIHKIFRGLILSNHI